ncbi:MAG: isoprenylcysteine carboxylmethyltransferase family protein [Verrucomicrobia bacterium]|nr:isoprenylcysteine carboxylmethyltransferase family protein [Verrucomicrobiota bacterium]
MSPRQLIVFAWVGLAIVWLVTGVLAKRTVRKQTSASRLLHLAFTTLGFVLIFNSSWRLGPLDNWLYDPSAATAYFGAALTLIGIAFAIWARFYLGSNWSGSVTVKADHALVQSGPYALVRHPIYTGILLAALGSSLAYPRARGFVGLAILVITLRIKSRLEERFMQEQFGAQYAGYKQDVKALVPFIW